jgi:two-component system sensor histidine kinase AlgZ
MPTFAEPLALWPILRVAFAEAPPSARNRIRAIVGVWILLIAVQIWDSARGTGVSAVAEFLSAVLGSGGAVLLGIAITLQGAMETRTSRPKSSNESPGMQRILIAIPAIAFVAGVALGGAAALMLVRTLLGVNFIVAVVGGTLDVVLLVVAAQTVTRSTRTLFTFAADQAASASAARAEAAAAQLRALQAQMNPHVLFNSLNTIASLVRANPAAAEGAVEDLADVLRQTLNRSAEGFGTLDQELAYVRACLAVEQPRWGDRLHVTWDIDPVALDRPFPALVLQPLVENALKHGIGSRVDGGAVHIRVSTLDTRTAVEVSDDGEGFSTAYAERTGLGNLRERLATLYGPDASLEICRDVPGGCVRVVVPARPSGTVVS